MSSTLARSIEILLEAETEESTRFVDIAFSLRLCEVAEGDRPEWKKETDEELAFVGGVWDRRGKCWAADRPLTRARVIRIHHGQAEAARYLADWLKLWAQGSKGDHWAAFERAWSVLMIGGRRAGKTHLACVFLVLAAVLMPRARVWAVSPTQEETDELEQILRSTLARRHYTFRGGGGGKPLQFKLANGSRILCLSGHKPQTLKRGRVDVALYNEAQNMPQKGWVQLRGAIADNGGLVLLAANPPDQPIGRWIEETYERAVAKASKVRAFQLTAEQNPFVDYSALTDMQNDAIDEATYRREVLGELVPIGDLVFFGFSLAGSVRDVPAGWADVTAEITKKKLGRGFASVVGMDFQRVPHMVGIVFKFFQDPNDADEVYAFVVDEVVVEDADENDLIDALEAQGYKGSSDTPAGDTAIDVSCVVMDASGWFQDGAHTKGRTSDMVLRSRGWRHLFKPQNDSDKNPDVLERVKTSNGRLKDYRGKRRLFISSGCPRTVSAVRQWENRNGFPYKRSDFAHVCDAFSYVIYRFFGRPKPKRRTGGSSGTHGTRVRNLSRRDQMRML